MNAGAPNPLRCALYVLLLLCAPFGSSQTFHWNWHDVQTANHTIEEDKRLSASEKSAVLKALTTQFENNFENDREPSRQAAATRVKAIDLNGDGVPEIVAQAVGNHSCSPTGNCAFWVFQKTALGYKVILSKGAVQNFTIQPSHSDGFSDLVLGMHGSATEQGLYLYRFNQGRYTKTACYDANWEYLDKQEEPHRLKDPRITPCQH